MIIMINGAFGIGKSTVAERLTNALTNSIIFDPEEVGSFVRRITRNVENPGDYQDIELWRTLTIQTAAELHKRYGRRLIIPMTIANLSYFREIKEGFSLIDPNLYHFCLTGSARTIHHRLEQRGDRIGSWPFRQTARCLEAFESPEFAKHIDAEKATPEDVAETIQNYLGTV